MRCWRLAASDARPTQRELAEFLRLDEPGHRPGRRPAGTRAGAARAIRQIGAPTSSSSPTRDATCSPGRGSPRRLSSSSCTRTGRRQPGARHGAAEGAGLPSKARAGSDAVEHRRAPARRGRQFAGRARQDNCSVTDPPTRRIRTNAGDAGADLGAGVALTLAVEHVAVVDVAMNVDDARASQRPHSPLRQSESGSAPAASSASSSV